MSAMSPNPADAYLPSADFSTGIGWLDGALKATLAYQSIKSAERIANARAQIASLGNVEYPENIGANIQDPRYWGRSNAISGWLHINNTTAVMLLVLAAAVGLVMVLR